MTHESKKKNTVYPFISEPLSPGGSRGAWSPSQLTLRFTLDTFWVQMFIIW